MNGLALTWRDWRPSDRSEYNFVLSSWVNSYFEATEFEHCTARVYRAIYTPVVKRLLATSKVAIACDPELPDTVIGYVVTQGNVVQYALTKTRFRKEGVARWMLADVRKTAAVYTHAPSAVALKLLGPTWTFNPNLRPFEDSHGQDDSASDR